MFEIKIPATTANLGPGFDSLGAALTMYATLTFEECHRELKIIGCDKKYRNKHNLIYTSYAKTFEIYGEKIKNVKIVVDSEIPPARGLGSSAACVIGGVAGALYMMGKDINNDTLLDISTVIEGHPDNVSPAIYGGLTASLKYGEKVFTEKYKVNDKIVFYAFIPDFSLATSDSRKVLPKNVKFKDATFNVARIPLLLRGLEYNK
jgi:homoserine kinase